MAQFLISANSRPAADADADDANTKRSRIISHCAIAVRMNLLTSAFTVNKGLPMKVGGFE